MEVQPDAAGNMNIVAAHEIAMTLYYVDELATDLWASLDAAIDRDTDPVTVACTVNPDTARVFRVGDFVVFNDEAQESGRWVPAVVRVRADRRSRQRGRCGARPATSSSSGSGRATTASGLGHVRDAPVRRTRRASGSSSSTSRRSRIGVKKGFFRTPGLPARIEAKLPSACVVAAVVGVANNFGYGPFTTFPLCHHSEPFMPGDRTCNGGAYTFQIPGALAVADTVVIPMRVQDSASIRCIYAYVQTPTTDGQSAYRGEVSRDDGATWELLEYMGIAQKLPDGSKNTYDFLVARGTASPPRAACRTTTSASSARGSTWRRSGADGRNRVVRRRTGWASMWASSSTSTSGRPTRSTSRCSPPTRTSRRSRGLHQGPRIGAAVRPTIWPTPILNEGDSLAFDILAVATRIPAAISPW